MLKNNIPLQVSITCDACGAVYFSSVMLLKKSIFSTSVYGKQKYLKFFGWEMIVQIKAIILVQVKFTDKFFGSLRLLFGNLQVRVLLFGNLQVRVLLVHVLQVGVLQVCVSRVRVLKVLVLQVYVYKSAFYQSAF